MLVVEAVPRHQLSEQAEESLRQKTTATIGRMSPDSLDQTVAEPGTIRQRYSSVLTNPKYQEYTGQQKQRQMRSGNHKENFPK